MNFSFSSIRSLLFRSKCFRQPPNYIPVLYQNRRQITFFQRMLQSIAPRFDRKCGDAFLPYAPILISAAASRYLRCRIPRFLRQGGGNALVSCKRFTLLPVLPVNFFPFRVIRKSRVRTDILRKPFQRARFRFRKTRACQYNFQARA